MRLCPDTNVLVRAVVVAATPEDERQATIARRLLRDADTIVLTLPALCEVAWVLRSAFRAPAPVVVNALRRLVDAANASCDRVAVEFGLEMAEAGGDFADGVIAQAGLGAGATRFVSFDRRAVRLISATGRDAAVPG